MNDSNKFKFFGYSQNLYFWFISKIAHLFVYLESDKTHLRVEFELEKQQIKRSTLRKKKLALIFQIFRFPRDPQALEIF